MGRQQPLRKREREKQRFGPTPPGPQREMTEKMNQPGRVGKRALREHVVMQTSTKASRES